MVNINKERGDMEAKADKQESKRETRGDMELKEDQWDLNAF